MSVYDQINVHIPDRVEQIPARMFVVFFDKALKICREVHQLELPFFISICREVELPIIQLFLPHRFETERIFFFYTRLFISSGKVIILN